MKGRINMGDNKNHQYDDIIDMPHHISINRPHMSIHDRAAQFAPFAAMTGHDVAVKEKARLTNERLDLDEGMRQLLDERLQLIRRNLDSRPDITLTYYIQDERKEGGEFATVRGKVKKIDEYKHIVIMEDELSIPIEDIVDIEGDYLERMGNFIL